jgi:hypothetical protein
MTRRKTDAAREARIDEEVIVDCYDAEEGAMPFLSKT